MPIKGIHLYVTQFTSTISVGVSTLSLTLKELMNKQDPQVEVIMFECDCCGKEHIIENADGFSLAYPDERAPKGWLFIKFGDVTSKNPLECLMCDVCKSDVITSLGFENLNEYNAVLKAVNSVSSDVVPNPGNVRTFVINTTVKDSNLN